MKSREFGTPKARADRWLRAIIDEYGIGSHGASAQRLVSTVVHLYESPADVLVRLTGIGRQIALEGHTLSDANRWIELLKDQAPEGLREALADRSAAVAIAQGWTEGTLGRREGLDSAITPLPALIHLLRQEYARCVNPLTTTSELSVLIVVDTSLVVSDRLDTQRLRISLLQHIRAVLGVAHPIAEGANGNLIALAERVPDLADKVAAIDERILNDQALKGQVIRVWIEPLASDAMHLNSHLADLVGTPLE